MLSLKHSYSIILLCLMIGYGAAEKFIMIIGGSGSKGTVEKFNPRTMNSTVVARHGKLGKKNGLRATPVNETHAFLLVADTPFPPMFPPPGIPPSIVLVPVSSHSFYMDKNGHLSKGPTLDSFSHHFFAGHITSLPSENGQLRPLYCNGRTTDECEVLSSDRSTFVYHSRLRTSNLHTLTAFGNCSAYTLIAVGSQGAMRFTGHQWKPISHTIQLFNRSSGIPHHERSGSTSVKLNDSALLSCGSLYEKQVCYVYNLESDTWVHAPATKSSVYFGEIVLVDQTVYAFGGYALSQAHGWQYVWTPTIQTLDISNGIENAQWTLEKAKLKANHGTFGVWVIDEPELGRAKRRTEKSYVYPVVYVVGMFLIAVAAIIVFIRM